MRLPLEILRISMRLMRNLFCKLFTLNEGRIIQNIVVNYFLCPTKIFLVPKNSDKKFHLHYCIMLYQKEFLLVR